MLIGERQICSRSRPYIVAEISGNHDGSLEAAKQLMIAAKQANADAVKLQIYDPKRLAEARGGADTVIEAGIWKDLTLGEIYDRAHTPVAWLPDLTALANDIGITWFASVFDKEDVATVKPYDPVAYKVSSFDIANKVLLTTVAKERKPTLISCGMGSYEEIGHAVHIMHSAGGVANVALMHCVSDYPADLDDTALWKIGVLRHKFQVPVGWSDHTTCFSASTAAIALDACIIERHIRLEGTPCLDEEFSLDEHEFADFVTIMDAVHDAIHPGKAMPQPYSALKVVS